MEHKLRRLEKVMNDRRLNDYTVVFLTTEDDASIFIRASVLNHPGIEAEVRTERDFINFFNDRRVDVLFIDNIDIKPTPGSLADKVFNGELTDVITRNKDISYYWYEED